MVVSGQNSLLKMKRRMKNDDEDGVEKNSLKACQNLLWG